MQSIFIMDEGVISFIWRACHTEVGVWWLYYRDGEDGIVMEKVIEP
jgi:hypothetical protein